MPDRPPQALRVAFLAADNEEARRAHARLEERYAHVPSDEADIVVALGGDGMMLETLHRFIGRGIPIFGMNRGTVRYNALNSVSASCAAGASLAMNASAGLGSATGCAHMPRDGGAFGPAVDDEVMTLGFAR